MQSRSRVISRPHSCRYHLYTTLSLNHPNYRLHPVFNNDYCKNSVNLSFLTDYQSCPNTESVTYQIPWNGPYTSRCIINTKYITNITAQLNTTTYRVLDDRHSLMVNTSGSCSEGEGFKSRVSRIWKPFFITLKKQNIESMVIW